jgi:hypothetical protein
MLHVAGRSVFVYVLLLTDRLECPSGDDYLKPECFMNRTSRLGLDGIGACVLGLVMTLGAAAGLYPHPTGSNINLDADILFAAVFFAGELVGLLGLGVLIYLEVYRRQRGKN